MKRKYLVITLYILFLAVLFEGSARLALHILQGKKTLIEDEVGWRQSWVARHKSTGKDVYYTFDLYDPTKGWISKPGLRDMQVFDNKILNTNSRGLRGRAEHRYKKQEGTTRILILGDSFTFGDEVSDHETYAHYLQEMLPDTEIINLGEHGYGHDQMLILLREEGIKYEPDIVILGFLPMDMSRNMLEFRDFAKPMFVLDGNELVLKGVPVPTPEEVIRWDWLRPRAFDMISLLYHFARKKLGLYDIEMEQKTSAILDAIVQTVRSIGAAPVIAYLPAGGDISPQQKPRQGETYLFSFCEENGHVECFSVRPAFAAKIRQGITFNKISHWGTAGHQTVAEGIHDYLIDTRHLQAAASNTEEQTLPR